MEKNKGNLLDGIILGLTVYLTHQTMYVWFVEYSFYGGSPQLQLDILLVIVFLILWRLRFAREEKGFILAWKDNWLVGLFISLAIVSLSWSVSFPATLYRSLLILFLSLIASYFAPRFSVRNLLNFIAIAVGVLALASLFVIVVFPGIGISTDPAYLGLWRGIFWHKIYLGATMALGYIAYLMILFSPQGQYTRLQKYIAAVMILISVFLAIKSDSASGLAVFVLQTIFFTLLLFWLKWGHLVSRWVYWLSGGGLLAIILLVVANLRFVFGFFNRSASMTGRVPMWRHLLDTYIAQRPLLGYGFGAFWMQAGIMQKVQSVVGWLYPVRVSDNGYLDVLLGVGLVGLLILMAILVVAFWRTAHSAFLSRDLISFFPLLVLVHILFINISLSYFLESESFIWFLLVLISFMYSPHRTGPSLAQV